jgi:predicted  nucleic acid-binding Zn-ribbon protein
MLEYTNKELEDQIDGLRERIRKLSDSLEELGREVRDDRGYDFEEMAQIKAQIKELQLATGITPAVSSEEVEAA